MDTMTYFIVLLWRLTELIQLEQYCTGHITYHKLEQEESFSYFI